ncbi:MAG: hypothetical protein JWO02_4084 [Solirubrobacterales bacterium]|nr:hypothetical protein [Solirubrobacterales bacterium]
MSGAPTKRRRAWITTALATAVAVVVPAPGAAASATQENVFQDDNLLLFRGDDTSDKTLRELKSLGVTRVRLTVPWRAFAPAHRATKRPASLKDPTDPRQYDPIVFDLHDHVVRVANRLGIKVLFNVTGGAPIWATGTRRGLHPGLQYRPDPKQFRQFVQMLATRYDGTYKDENQGNVPVPRVDAWSIWNEPNQGAGLQPQWERNSSGRLLPVAPRIYRALAQSAISALNATGHGKDIILLGETAPRGVDRRTTTGSLRPVPFLAGVLCLDATTLKALRGRAARDQGCDRKSATRKLGVTGYGHHPYSIVSSPSTPDADVRDITLADAPRLGRLLDAGARLGRLPKNLPYWWTEYGWQTLPPDPIRGVDPLLQAQWIAEAEQQTRADGRTAALTQFLLIDDLPRDEPGQTLDRKWGTYQTGIKLADGTPKPAYDAYRLPFVIAPDARAGGTVDVWGLVRPVSGGAVTVPGTARLQFAAPGTDSFQDIGDPIAVAADGVVRGQMLLAQAGRYRFRWSPPPGPATRPTGLQGIINPTPQAAAPAVFTSAVATVRGA